MQPANTSERARKAMAARLAAPWRKQAKCLGMDPEAFYPDYERQTLRMTRKQEAEAIKVCRRCPVVSECLADALLDPPSIDFGVRGGIGWKERRMMRRLPASQRLAAATS